jgi:uncharacterized repeat protein (TIGR01451 family)
VREIVNQGVVTSNEVPPIPTNDPRTPAPGDPTRVQIPPSPLLTADKNATLVTDADGNGAPSAGDTLEYAVTIKNIGNAPATGVIYTDTPDANTTLVPGSVQTSQGTVTGGNAGTPPITVDIGSIPVNASVTISYRVTINKPLPPAVQVIVNQGVVTSNELPPIPTNDPRTPPKGDPTRVPVTPPPQLTADKADILVVDSNNTGKPGAGDILLYLITIANRGNGAALAVNFADTPDPNTTLVAGTVQTSQGKVTKGNTAGDTSVAVSIGTIAPGANVTISFRVRLNDSLSSSRIANQGTITGGNTPPVPTNDPDTPAPGDPTVTIIPPGELTAVALTSFTAAREGGAVVVRWATAAELNTWGFYLLRSADADRDHATRVTPELIPGQGRGQGGASYQWTDTSAAPGATYYYWLQEVEVNGTIAEYGPAATIAPAGQYRVLLPVAMR